MNKKDTFARNLVKGKIVETILAQMLRETGEFTVLEFGYEKIIPELVQQGYREDEGVLETLRTAPDFAVINKETKQVHLIEVKYHSTMGNRTYKYILEQAQRMHESWNPSYLFVGSHTGFYFGEISEIIEKEGKIDQFAHKQISQDVQERYLKILNDFEQ